MKCLIMAGGRGERLWPLSRKNYPKQFIQIQQNHSIFQETIARNMPYCDEFIIITLYEYRYIIESQMAVFQGVTYRCIYEEIPKKTAAIIMLSCMDLQPSELIYIVPSDQLIQADNYSTDSALNYKDSILFAKQYASQGAIAIFGLNSTNINQAFGWIQNDEDKVVSFSEKISKEEFNIISNRTNYLQYTGLMIFENGNMQNELKTIMPEFYKQGCEAYKQRKIIGNDLIYSTKVLEKMPSQFLETILFKNLNKLRILICGFGWADIGRLEDLAFTEYSYDGLCVKYNADNTNVINNTTNQIVLVNEVTDLMVVNTQDAIYIGKHGASDNLKDILPKYPELTPFLARSKIFYRSWGFYEQLYETVTYRIRRVILYPGKTIYAHSHKQRSENWTIVKGDINVILDDISYICNEAENIDIPIGMVHQISNIGLTDAIFVETACGEILHEQDMISKPTANLNENQLGIKIEPFVKLLPAFKDYIWGGTKLRDIYGKKCDYNTIAESWELSAHPAGQSIIASGRHKGMPFGTYLETVGRKVLGWKCQSMMDFPLMVKFIDAKENLSIQVHPDDDYALEHEHEYGKNEMWYILECEPESMIYIGFNHDVSREEVELRINNHTILTILNKISTHPGDVFFIPAGTVHAIGAGNLICEIQQSSNCTYRLYDYDRRDKYGNPRELHLQKALDVLNYKKYKAHKFESEKLDKGIVLSRCKYFETIIYDIDKKLKLKIDDSHFTSLVCISGSGSINYNEFTEMICTGESVFINASNQNIELNGKMKIIVSYI